MYDIDKKNIVIAKHTYYDSDGTPEAELVRYLRGRAACILDILNPFSDAESIPLNTTVTAYGPDGSIAKKTIAPLITGWSVIHYIKDFLLTVYYVILSVRKYDLFIGSNNLNTFAGLFLRAIGRVRHVAYYVIDFSPVRFENKLLDSIYHAINKICCYRADVIWNVSPTMIEGRERRGIRKDSSAPQITVPLGCSFNDITRKAAGEVKASDIVYFGSLREEHGPGLIIEALPRIVGEMPDVTVTIAGGGELSDTLRDRAADLGVSSNVHFTGYLDSGDDIYNTLTAQGLALATYPPVEQTYKLYSDPGKVKIYLACGLPMMITGVPPIAETIQERGAGILVEFDPVSLADAVISIVNDREKYLRMRENAVALGAEYDWNTVWDRTFGAMEL